MTTTTSSARTGFGDVINARDFSRSTKDVLRDTWTVGKMHHVIKALGGRPVAITVDIQTGFTLVGARLLAAYYDGYGPRVRTESVLADGNTQQTNYRLHEVGMILVLPTGEADRVKWDALQSYRDHVAAALEAARAEYEGTTGRRYGVWSGTVLDGGSVDVRYTPLDNPPAGKTAGERGYWRIRVTS